MSTYEPIMNALIAYLQSKIGAQSVLPIFNTIKRGIVMWENLAIEVNGTPLLRQPALFLYDGPEFGGGKVRYEYKAGRADPVVRIISRTIAIYANANAPVGLPGGTLGGPGISTTGGGTFLSPLIEAVETALTTPDNPATGTLTLGGLVAYCRIEGQGVWLPPDIDPQGQGMATVPLEIKVP